MQSAASFQGSLSVASLELRAEYFWKNFGVAKTKEKKNLKLKTAWGRSVSNLRMASLLFAGDGSVGFKPWTLWSWAVADMSFLCRAVGLRLRDGVCSSDICRKLGVEPLCVKRSPLRFRYLIRMHPGHLPVEVFWGRPMGRRPQNKPKIHWRNYTSHLAWQHLRVLQEELENVAQERNVWTVWWTCCPHTLTPNKQLITDGWICVDEHMSVDYREVVLLGAATGRGAEAASDNASWESRRPVGHLFSLLNHCSPNRKLLSRHFTSLSSPPHFLLEVLSLMITFSVHEIFLWRWKYHARRAVSYKCKISCWWSCYSDQNQPDLTTNRDYYSKK